VESWSATFYVIFQKSLETILKNIEWLFSSMYQNLFFSGVRVISEEDDPTPVDLADIEAATLSDPGKTIVLYFDHYCQFLVKIDPGKTRCW
jgi:hypothetical protein